jgi:hypothetical protein
MDEVVYGRLINSNHLLLIHIVRIYKFVNKSARWLFLHGISDIDGVLRIVDKEEVRIKRMNHIFYDFSGKSSSISF